MSHVQPSCTGSEPWINLSRRECLNRLGLGLGGIALAELLGKSAALSPATIVRLNAQFKAEYDEWRQQSLADQRFVYIWFDGVPIKAGVAR